MRNTTKLLAALYFFKMQEKGSNSATIILIFMLTSLYVHLGYIAHFN